ncbi:hypothetical protein BC830DRAFT_1110861 [Chytriomyces sp. MP71]|nr:hypothetical protein BC830DRAFT_1110861 [Chytriomyces sp. MP71]
MTLSHSLDRVDAIWDLAVDTTAATVVTALRFLPLRFPRNRSVPEIPPAPPPPLSEPTAQSLAQPSDSKDDIVLRFDGAVASDPAAMESARVEVKDTLASLAPHMARFDAAWAASVDATAAGVWGVWRIASWPVRHRRRRLEEIERDKGCEEPRTVAETIAQFLPERRTRRRRRRRRPPEVADANKEKVHGKLGHHVSLRNELRYIRLFALTMACHLLYQLVS